MNLDFLFNAANLFVLPFWFLMILLPNWGITRKVMGSVLPFVVLAGLYIYLFANSLDPDSAQSFANPQLSDLARLFADERVTATGWIHFLVMDLFVGRWIYWEGQRTGVWTTHSLLFCLFAGPIGLLSHLATQAFRQTFLTRSTSTVAASTVEESRSTASGAIPDSPGEPS
ncbi:ABA4-like family protein [Leptolyngbya ohadii]|uniref:ABA4-like family protein n=1 Tax=Leptolyngbya ohadii TaxID=1962290 RepID=UPI000B598961|nr:ABA4-like family protein [Leptolyngbya ohadii]